MGNDWTGSAIYGGAKYRYVLRRQFLTGSGRVAFIMLNPSTATAEKSDPTVRRCEGFAKQWNYAELVVLNLFALRSTDPKKLYKDEDPVGPENDTYIKQVCVESHLVICAWGVHGALKGRGKEVLAMVSIYKPHYLKLTRDGIPGHPLYLRADEKPTKFVFIEPMTGPIGRSIIVE